VTSAGTYTVTVTDGNGCTAYNSVTVTLYANPTPVITGTSAFCTGSSSILDAGGPYAGYSWSTGATTQTITVGTAGSYTVTVTDANGCTGSDTKTITTFTNPTPSISGTLDFCSGKTTTLTATGGFNGYLW